VPFQNLPVDRTGQFGMIAPRDHTLGRQDSLNVIL
jgi:hypothetical protein